jgi:hypothetical protein
MLPSNYQFGALDALGSPTVMLQSIILYFRPSADAATAALGVSQSI